jgi:tetratricopeptide (TPR) repeat protein
MTAISRLALPFTLGLAFSFMSISAIQASASSEANKLREDWAVAKFSTPKKQQVAQFEQLIKQAEAVQTRYPNNPNVLVWHGTILASYASIRGGLGSLPSVKKSRKLLEQGIRLDRNVEGGFAQAVLGSVYARVPGWPVAFGSKQKARTYLETAMRISPKGIDTNYYYGDFLADVGEYQKARTHLEAAQRAPIRKGYTVQDLGRKGEVAHSLHKLKRL